MGNIQQIQRFYYWVCKLFSETGQEAYDIPNEQVGIPVQFYTELLRMETLSYSAVLYVVTYANYLTSMTIINVDVIHNVFD